MFPLRREALTSGMVVVLLLFCLGRPAPATATPINDKASSRRAERSLFVLGDTLSDPLKLNGGKKPAFRGFYTVAQVHQLLEELHLQLPEWVSPVYTLGKSLENRSIEAVCVGRCDPLSASASWNTTEGRRNIRRSAPALLLTALHHAREPLGMMVSFRFVRELLTAAANDDTTVRTLLQQKQIWFVPVVNPDGYQWNLDNAKKCSRNTCMARKNRRKMKKCQPQDMGVDLNRNYDYEFAFDNKGSVDGNHDRGQCDDAYRGAQPFSEPETRAMKFLMDHVVFDVALNWHSFGQVINVPYSHAKSGTPKGENGNVLFGIAERMTRGSGFLYGQASQNGLYTVNGEAGDYMFGKKGIFAFAPEVGPYFHKEPFSSGMWPEAKSIRSLETESLPIAAQALWATGPQLETIVTKGVFTIVEPGSDSRLPCVQTHVEMLQANIGTRPINGKIFTSLIDVATWESQIRGSCPMIRTGALNEHTSTRCDNAACEEDLWLQYLYDLPMRNTWLSTSRDRNWKCKLAPRKCKPGRSLSVPQRPATAAQHSEGSVRQLDAESPSIQRVEGLKLNESMSVTLKQCSCSSCDNAPKVQRNLKASDQHDHVVLGLVVSSGPSQCSIISLSARQSDLKSAKKGETVELLAAEYPLIGESKCFPCAAFRYKDVKGNGTNPSTALGCAHSAKVDYSTAFVDGSKIDEEEFEGPGCRASSLKPAAKKSSLVPSEFKISKVASTPAATASGSQAKKTQQSVNKWSTRGWTAVWILVVVTVAVAFLIWRRRKGQRAEYMRMSTATMGSGENQHPSFREADESDDDHVHEVAKATAAIEASGNDGRREESLSAGGSSLTETDSE